MEHQEQYKEDPVQPTTREDAVTLTKLLTTSLPLGSIQVQLTAAIAYAKFASVLVADGRQQAHLCSAHQLHHYAFSGRAASPA